MKKAIVLSVLVVSQLVSAQIKNSQKEARHQSVVLAAIEQNCGTMNDLVEVAQKSHAVKVDQGITDIVYSTVLTATSPVDQLMTVNYEISVASKYTDAFDHATGEYGIYSVESVFCKQK